MNNGKLNGKARKCIFLSYAQGEWGYRLLCSKLNSLVVTRENIFDKSLVRLGKNDCRNIYMDLDSVQFMMELQSETSKLADARMVINTNNTCSKKKLVEPTIVVDVKSNKVYVQSPHRCRCNNGIALSVIEETEYENPYGVAKNASGISILMRSNVMTKFKRGLDLEDFVAVEPLRSCGRVTEKFKL